MRNAAHPDRDNRLIVEGLDTRRVVGDGLENGIDYFLSRTGCVLRNDFLDPAASEQVSLAIPGVEHAIAEEYEHIAGLHTEVKFVVLGLIEEAKRQAGCFDHFILSGVNVDWSRQPRVRNRQGSMRIVPHRVN